ncbi:hypothetical protein WJX75_006143 [Coccomyxa subellipsoidea]|uniref:Uncharacterized protein n=1 Tax=Coccomyxa subellipsoidea TaxID=248742 RepID=A0ABR2YVV9_9CHLO
MKDQANNVQGAGQPKRQRLEVPSVSLLERKLCFAPETADVSDGQQKESQGAGQKGERRRAGIVELQTDKEKVPGSELT